MKDGRADGVVYIVDDDVSYLAALQRVLRAAGHVARTFASAQAYLAEQDDTPGCLLADLRMPGVDGLQLQQSLARDGATRPMIFLSAAGDIPSTVQAMRHGAEDFLTKDAALPTLLAAIERALARDGRQRAQRGRIGALRSRLDLLSTREREVLQHVVRGRLNKQIASDLSIAERTVKLHRTAITTKLQVRSTAELVQLVQQAQFGAGDTVPDLPERAVANALRHF